jgi:hypothetical protein
MVQRELGRKQDQAARTQAAHTNRNKDRRIWVRILAAGISTAAGYFVVDGLCITDDEPAPAIAANLNLTAAQDSKLDKPPAQEESSASSSEGQRIVSVAPEPTRAIATAVSNASLAAETPLDLMEAAKIVNSEFGYWIGLARKAGLSDVPEDLRAPASSMVAIASEYLKYHRATQAVETVRVPTVDSIADRKAAVGNAELYDHPEGMQDPAAKRAAEQAIRAARKPTRPGQSVIVGGDSGRIRIVRVDLSDDPSLLSLQQAFEEAQRTYIQNVYMIVAPHLPNR